MRYMLGIMLLVFSGCSAHYWGGENMGRTPGVHVRTPSLFSRGELSVTSDCNAEVGRLSYSGSTETQPATVNLENAKFGQAVAPVLREIPAVLDATARVQYVQVQYFEQIKQTVIGLAHELMPLFNILAMARIQGSTETGWNMSLPSGLSIGGKKVTQPQDLSKYFEQVSTWMGKTAAKVEEASIVPVPTSLPAPPR